MLSLSDYLLIKLNEECIELADAAIDLATLPSIEAQKEFSGEYNDVLGVLSMVTQAGIGDKELPEDAALKVKSFASDIESDNFVNSVSTEHFARYIAVIARRVAKQALQAGKIANKCLVFGLHETYVGATLHNANRLLIEIGKLKALCKELVDHYPTITLSDEAQNKKRHKMAKYIPISLEYKTIDVNGFDAFNELVNRMDIQHK